MQKLGDSVVVFSYGTSMKIVLLQIEAIDKFHTMCIPRMLRR